MKIKGLILLGCLGTLSFAVQSNQLDANMKAQNAEIKQAKASQGNVDKLYEQKVDALQDYRITKAEIDQLNVYNRQLRAIIKDQEEQVVSLENQIKEIEVTQQGIMPLMERMLATLDQFVSLDVPFLIQERQERIANLRVLLLSSDVTISEKFRRVLEAFQIEIEYGRTIEAYRGSDQNGNVVDFLRLGRVALYSVALDESEAMAWDKNNKQWLSLDSGYIPSLNKGIRIARKQSAPALLDLNLPGLGRL